LVALRHGSRDLIRFQYDEMVLGGLVSLDLLVAVDLLPRFRIDELPLHAVPGLAVDRVERDALGGGRGRVERDRTAQFLDLEMSLPQRARHEPAPVADSTPADGQGSAPVPLRNHCRSCRVE